MFNRFKKLVIFNFLIILVNVVLFSNAFLKLDIFGGNILISAFCITVIIMSFILFFYVNYSILFKKSEPNRPVLKDKDIITLDNCNLAIKQYIDNNIKTFRNDLTLISSQILRFNKKKASIREALLEKFSSGEMSFSKFNGAVESVEKVIILNIKGLLNRLNAFDEDEFEYLLKDYLSGSKLGNISKEELNSIVRANSFNKVTESRVAIYYECTTFIDNVITGNEEILVRLDKLLIEISKLIGSLGEHDIAAINEIDELINNVKWYN